MYAVEYNLTRFENENNDDTRICYQINWVANKKITWHFIPATSPHFGGLWEDVVKSLKQNLRRELQESTLILEELSTVLKQIEAFLNSKAMCPLSSDINNLEILTPGHFLIGRALLARPNPDCTETKLGPLQRCKYKKLPIAPNKMVPWTNHCHSSRTGRERLSSNSSRWKFNAKVSNSKTMPIAQNLTTGARGSWRQQGQCKCNYNQSKQHSRNPKVSKSPLDR
jgi:hypothetical protein